MTEPERDSETDLEQRAMVRGERPGNRYVRIVRPFAREFERKSAGYLVATEQVLAPKSQLGRFGELARRALLGARIRSAHELQERVGVIKGLAVFASDNISSSAYATEEIMRVLLLAGLGAMAALTMPITLPIIVAL